MLRKFSYEDQKSGRAKNYKLWQDGFHPVIVDTFRKMEQRVNYIHYNPVEAEIVFHERDYVNSSYRNYEEDNSVCFNVNVEPLGYYVLKNRVVNALFSLQKKVGTRRRRAPDGVSWMCYITKCTNSLFILQVF
ncbi:hypothetical protein [Flavobacterium franklandianum]|uniref:hypothetical protein n=1 Tax=Flavobacterium franklandianum TaxID=2594430 RepID=UPI001F47556D|nr:hypothetical protein [Flavobacterium franklandianum]